MSKIFDGAKHLLPVSERSSLEKGLRKMKARREGKLPSLISIWPKFNDAFCDGLEWRTITVVGARPGTGPGRSLCPPSAPPPGRRLTPSSWWSRSSAQGP